MYFSFDNLNGLELYITHSTIQMFSSGATPTGVGRGGMEKKKSNVPFSLNVCPIIEFFSHI